MKENHNILLSIVIPAYNAEPYLRKCVDSCIHQVGEVPHYEIVIVNDGSTDNTQGIIDEYNAKYDIVSYIRQSNGGLSKARNEGLKVAKGNYVWFVDSDDWIAENALSVLASIIIKDRPDVITFKSCDWKEGELITRRSPYNKDMGELAGMDILKIMGTKMWNPCVPFYCMKRKMLLDNSLSFMEGIIHEDSEFTPRMLYYAHTAYASSEILYYVYQNPVSLNRQKNPDKGFHTLRVVDSLCKFSVTIPNRSERRIFNDIIATTMNMGMKETRDMDQARVATFCIKIHKGIVSCMIDSTKIKHKIEGILLMFMPRAMVRFISKHQ